MLSLRSISWPCANHLNVNFMHMSLNIYSKWINLHLQWFEEKQQQIETLDQQLKKLHQSIEMLFVQRKGWSTIILKKKRKFSIFSIQLVVSLERYLKKLKLTRKRSLVNSLNFPHSLFCKQKTLEFAQVLCKFLCKFGCFKSFFKDL